MKINTIETQMLRIPNSADLPFCSNSEASRKLRDKIFKTLVEGRNQKNVDQKNVEDE